MKNAFEIIFEDDQIIILDKKAGIPVIPARGKDKSISVKELLLRKREEVLTVHRIDEETSGLILFAKDAHSHRVLNKQFRERVVHKKYTLLTRGIPNPKEGEITFNLKKLNNQNKSIIARDGKEATTQYQVIEEFNNISLCEAAIMTGRHHQIRVHFKSINCPLLVDPVYGDSGFFLSEIKAKKYNKGKHEEEKPLLNRLSLHASHLSFHHPKTEENLEFYSELPKDLRACINQLKKLIN